MLTPQFKKDQTVHYCHSSPWFSPRIIATSVHHHHHHYVHHHHHHYVYHHHHHPPLRHQPLHQSHSAARLYLPEGELGNKERRPINNQAKSFFLSDKPSGRIQNNGTHPYEAFAWHLLQNPISPKHTKNSQGPTTASSKDPWDEIEVGTPKPHVFVRCGIQMRLRNMKTPSELLYKMRSSGCLYEVL